MVYAGSKLHSFGHRKKRTCFFSYMTMSQRTHQLAHRPAPLYLRRRAVAFSLLFNFALPTRLLSPEPGGDQGTLFTHNVTRDVALFYFLVLYLFYFFRLDTSHPCGAVGSVTFRLGYLMPPHFPRRASGAVGGFWHDFPLS